MNGRLVATKYKHHIPDVMSIDWYIGKRCNFACSYCADFIHDNYSAHLPFEKMKVFVDTITDIYGPRIRWSLTGGEPTLNPDFLKLLEYLQDKKIEISICTNGSRSLDYLLKMFALSDCIVLSLHFEHISKRIDEYINKALTLEKWRCQWNQGIPLKKKGVSLFEKHLILRFMLVPGFMKEIKYMTNSLSSHFEKVEHRIIRPQKKSFVEKHKVQTQGGFYKWKERLKTAEIGKHTKVSPNSDNKSPAKEIIERERRWYSEEDRAVLEEFYKNTKSNRKWLVGFLEKENGDIVKEEYYYNDLNYQRKTNFKGWTCYAGVTLLKIAPNGDIFIANCFQGGSLGNIYNIDKNFKLPTKPVVCEKLRCTDPLDLRQSKYIEEKYKNLVL